MLTLFTTAKAFAGHSGVIQRNALKSWTLLHPDVEVVLFGDDEGAAEVCTEFGLRHEPHVERDESGLKRIDYFFDRAQEIAQHDILCYVNCDIILTSDFCRAIEQVRAAHSRFLMVGRRWDTEIKQPIGFTNPGWAEETRQRAIAENCQRDWWFIDYFAFSRGLYHRKLPPFVIGRVAWDNWLTWYAIDSGVPVVDASAVVLAIHQNHDYGYHPLGKQGVWNDELSQRNIQHAGGWNHLWTIADATELLRPGGLRPNLRSRWRAFVRMWQSLVRMWQSLQFNVWHPIWFSVLDLTRPLRSTLGLRREASRRSNEKI